MAHLVGKRIEVYWDGDARFYKGRVARYAPRTGRHEVAYDDDETEWLRLDRARHRFVDGGGSRYTIEWEWADEKAQGAHAAAVAQLVAAVGATPQVASTYLDAHGSPEAAAERYLRDRDGDRPRRAARGAAPKREPATPPRRPAKRRRADKGAAAGTKATVDDDEAAPLVQGVDDEWADWRGCVCGGSYYGEMVACEGGCDNWFHFACVGLTRLPRGEWLCQDCKTKPKKRRVEKQPEPLPSPPKKKKENRAHSKEERKDREELEALVEKARPLRFEGGMAPADHACAGAGFCSLDPKVFAPLRQLHGNIVAALKRGKLLQSWEGKGSDVRKKGYAFLPASLAKWDRKRLEACGLQFWAPEKEGLDAKRDCEANWRSSFTLLEQDVDRKARKALAAVVDLVKERVAEKYRKYVSLENLIALQPNLHNDARHLPPHLDFPMHEGFGVVIVTIQMAGPPSIIALLKGTESDFEVFTEEQREKCWTFPLQVGDCYVLSGDARNVCDHGVLCGSSRRSAGADEPRESMNLRFGLHTPAFANKEVYWQFAPRKERKPKREPKPRAAPTRASARLAKPSAADTQP